MNYKRYLYKQILALLGQNLPGLCKLPNFLLIGFPKCGTTSLHYYLKQHPDVFLPFQKELHFLNSIGVDQEQLDVDFYPNERLIRDVVVRSIEEYKGSFFMSGRKSMIGEMTPSYALTPDRTIGAIEKYIPEPRNVKIVVMVRNPIDAFYSQYCMHRRNGLHFLEIEDSIQVSKIYEKYGHIRMNNLKTFEYSLYLPEFMNKFKDVLLLSSEQLKNKPLETMALVCDFLGLKNFSFDTSQDFNSGNYNQPLSDKVKCFLREYYQKDVDYILSEHGVNI